MRISIAAIGRLKAGPEKTLIDDYAARIVPMGRPAGISGFGLVDGDAPRALDGPARQAREAAMLQDWASGADYRIALDETGAMLTSAGFADLLRGLAEAGRQEVAFLIGGADGHVPQTRSDADKLLSLGKMTLPHMLARCVLVEQIYRATTILAGHPYHRG